MGLDWHRLHPEMSREVLTHDYFTCPLCEDSWMVEWAAGVVSCHQCGDHVMVQGHPNSCPVCGSTRCVDRVLRESILLEGRLPCHHVPDHFRAEVGDQIWCSACDRGWDTPKEIV